MSWIRECGKQVRAALASSSVATAATEEAASKRLPARQTVAVILEPCCAVLEGKGGCSPGTHYLRIVSSAASALGGAWYVVRVWQALWQCVQNAAHTGSPRGPQPGFALFAAAAAAADALCATEFFVPCSELQSKKRSRKEVEKNTHYDYYYFLLTFYYYCRDH